MNDLYIGKLGEVKESEYLSKSCYFEVNLMQLAVQSESVLQC